MIDPRLDPVAAAPAFHGGPSAVDGQNPPVEVDFSTNVNAFGPPPTVLRALRAADPTAYPDPAAHGSRAAFARWCDIDYDRVALTAGACDALDRIARTFLTAGDVALIAAPAFAEYARAAAMAGAAVREVWASELSGPCRSPHAADLGVAHIADERGAESRHLDPPLDRILEAVEKFRPRLLFLASPSSPLGLARPSSEIDALADALRGCGLLILDESYRAFQTGRLERPLRPRRDDVVHVRSITKDFALAGVRAAFVVAQPRMIRAIGMAGPPWAVSTSAQAASTAAFTPAALEHVARTIEVLRSERARLAEALAALGADPLPGDTHVLCFRIHDADALTERLRQRGIRIRPCRSFGWPDVARIAARTPAENDVLLERLREAVC